MSRESNNKWFWAWLIQITVAKAEVNNRNARVEIWKNLVVLEAPSAAKALLKAWKIGSVVEGDGEGTLRLNGKPAITKFLGVQDIGLIEEDLADGCEIIWQLKRCRLHTARALVKPPDRLVVALAKEVKGGTPSKRARREADDFVRGEVRKMKMRMRVAH